MVFGEVPIEESVVLDHNYPSVSERYFTNYYFIPDDLSKSNSASGYEKSENGKNCTENINSQDTMEEATPGDKENSDTFEEEKESLPSPDKTGHTCVMVHTNKLCLLTLSHRHPVLAEKKEITDVSSWNFIACSLNMYFMILYFRFQFLEC